MAETATDPTISSQIRKTFDVLAELGTPTDVLEPLRQYVTGTEQIRQHQYQPAKENAQLRELRVQTVRTLAGIPGRIEREAAAERDRELRAIEAETTQARVLPNRQLAETDGEYTAKMLRQSITEQRDLAAITASSADVALALASTDPELLATLVREALEDGHPERIRRVSRAAEMPLSRLAVAEARKRVAPGGPTPAATAAQAVANQLREWRAHAAELAKSPKVRRERINAKYDARVMEARNVVGRAADPFGMKQEIERGLKGASQFTGL